MLDLHQNNFVSFSSVPISEKLDTVNLAFNQLVNLENLENAVNLTVLDLHNNKMKQLPDTILNLMNLKTLKISNNELGDINPRLALLEDLVRINIEGNPLRSIKPAMRNAGAVQLKKYLQMKLDDGEIA
jgi:Leucine-rich repeat (LRR) protein